MKMRIVLVDDDIGSIKRLEQLIAENTDNSTEIMRFSSGEDLLENFSADSFDLIILDIFMNRLTGVDTARKIRETDKNVKLVFCTSSNDFACESYEVNACYYLRKPFTDEDFAKMLDRTELDKLELMRSIRLPDGQPIVLRNIIYADFSSHYMTFHNKNGANTVSRVSFSEVEPILCDNSYFCSPSKGVVVNFYEVKLRDSDVFLMSDGTRIPISRRKSKEVREEYARFRFDILRCGGER